MKLEIIDVRAEMPNYQKYKDLRRNDEILGIAIHHSVTVNHKTGKPVGNAQSFSYYHVYSLGWDHGRYNYVINAHGQIEYALDDRIAAYNIDFKSSADTVCLEIERYWNNHYIAICLSGWFEQNRTYHDATGRKRKIPNRYTRPTKAQRQSLLLLIQYLRQEYNIPVENIRGHCELEGCETACPGSNFDLDQLRESILRTGHTRKHPLSRPIQRVLVIQEETTEAIPVLDQFTQQQKTTIKWLINNTLRITVLLIILGLLPAMILVWSSPLSGVNLLLRIILSCFLLTVMLISLLRWISPPTSAFMLQVRASRRRNGEDDTIDYYWVDYKNISPRMHLAAVAFEDPHFPEHTGFAWGHILQVWQANRAGKFLGGASTISQQLAKNLLLWSARTYFRKLVESYVTLLLEVILSKRRILEIYLNIVQFDKNVFGVGAASEHFFKKSAGELTAEEAALLVAVLSNPVIYRVDNPSPLVRRRQTWILEKMQELGSDYLRLIN